MLPTYELQRINMCLCTLRSSDDNYCRHMTAWQYGIIVCPTRLSPKSRRLSEVLFSERSRSWSHKVHRANKGRTQTVPDRSRRIDRYLLIYSLYAYFKQHVRTMREYYSAPYRDNARVFCSWLKGIIETIAQHSVLTISKTVFKLSSLRAQILWTHSDRE